ncbi:MAG: alpha/beta hydrolase [Archangium sp.]|nr:alpha/beta hydrolase [Archangium sp.]
MTASVNSAELWHQSSDGKKIFLRRFLPDAPPRAVLHLAHGLAEHSARYARLAEALTGAGFVVYANDHRGHGKTAATKDELGFFDGGLDRVIADQVELIAFEKREHPGLPFVLMGHSMGSFFVQRLMQTHGAEFTAVVLSGSAGKPNLLASAGRLIARMARLRRGPRGHSPLIRALAFDAFNDKFSPKTTRFEWLSRDRAEVDKYANDPLCGFDCSTQLWVELLDALGELARPELQKRIPSKLPVYIFSGSQDPAGDFAKSVKQLVGALRAAGVADVTERIYEAGRHEMLNETNRAEVTTELLAWLNAKVPQK